ncbi:hypothetical protein GOBAR_AA35561 [Gossypium barbadense]|uniref:Uncharacterized protein n=1 Tax=Gossypium barbadense TaxID=3634 RepID=A0A2P5W211_GOSBA|nr:hypothetical protein GOBAR_AA35561 [Gossypium barbadense]
MSTEEELANLTIDEDEGVSVRSGEEEVDVGEDFNLCLVGKVLTESLVHFLSMKNTLTNLWHPFEASRNENLKLEGPRVGAPVDSSSSQEHVETLLDPIWIERRAIFRLEREGRCNFIEFFFFTYLCNSERRERSFNMEVHHILWCIGGGVAKGIIEFVKTVRKRM